MAKAAYIKESSVKSPAKTHIMEILPETVVKPPEDTQDTKEWAMSETEKIALTALFIDRQRIETQLKEVAASIETVANEFRGRHKLDDGIKLKVDLDNKKWLKDNLKED